MTDQIEEEEKTYAQMAKHYLKLAVPAIVNAVFMALVW